MANVNRPADKGLRTKLWVAGEDWANTNDRLTAAGKPRKYRIVEAAQNGPEDRSAREAIELFRNPARWSVLLPNEKTLSRRSLAFRMLAKQQACALLYLAHPHRQHPFKFFSAWYDNTLEALAQDWEECDFDDFVNYMDKSYPGEKLLGDECDAMICVIAEDTVTETTNSECAHSYWQCQARQQSHQTHAATFCNTGATLLLHQARKCEKATHVMAAPKPIGRPSKDSAKKRKKKEAALERTKKTKKTKGVTKNTGLKRVQHGGWGAYRAWLHVNPRKGIFGGAQMRGRSIEYAAFKQQPGFKDFESKAKAKTISQSLGLGKNASLPNDPLGTAFGVDHAISTDGSAREATAFANHVQELTNQTLQSALQQLTLEDGDAIIRKFLTALSKTCRLRTRAQAIKLGEWGEDAANDANHAVFGASVPVGGVTVAPTPGTFLKRVVWQIPAIDMASRIAKGAGEPRTIGQLENMISGDTPYSVHSSLRDRWSHRMQMFIHEQQAELGKVAATRWTSSLCRHTGVHLCRKLALRLFRDHVVAYLRPFYAKTPTNSFKALFEGGHCVLRLSWKDVGETEDLISTFHYIPIANQVSWALVMMDMLEDEDPLAVREAQAAGHMALIIGCIEEDLQDPFINMGMEIFPKQFEIGEALVSTCAAQVYHIVESDRKVVDFKPCQVEVRADALPSQAFWPGSEQAIANHKLALAHRFSRPAGHETAVPIHGPGSRVMPSGDRERGRFGTHCPSWDPGGSGADRDGGPHFEDPFDDWATRIHDDMFYADTIEDPPTRLTTYCEVRDILYCNRQRSVSRLVIIDVAFLKLDKCCAPSVF